MELVQPAPVALMAAMWLTRVAAGQQALRNMLSYCGFCLDCMVRGRGRRGWEEEGERNGELLEASGW